MSKVAIAVLLPCILAAIVAAERNYTTLAGEYCSKFARLPESKCGWVPYEGFEYNATIDDTGCWDCGTGLVEMDGDDGPGILDPGDAGYFKEFFNFLSLNCTGYVQIQTVFKVADYMDIYGLADAGLDFNKTRCSLGKGRKPEPIGNGKDWKGRDCVECKENVKCPIKEGEWYSETAIISLGPTGDCGEIQSLSADTFYSPHHISIYTNAGMKLDVQSFTATQVKSPI